MFSTSDPPIADEMLSLFAPVITVEDKFFLCAIPLEKEVVQALSSLGSTKAHRPDGFTTLFYKKFWSVVNDEVLACINNFFQITFCCKSKTTLILPRSLNKVVLTLSTILGP
jgi:hypothetical protein